MAFGQELKDFVAAFQTGSQLVGDVQDRKLRAKEQASQAKLRDAQTRAVEAELTPEALARKERLANADVNLSEAQAAQAQEAVRLSQDPEQQALKRRAVEADVTQSEAAAEYNRAGAEATRLETQQKREKYQRLQDSINERLRSMGIDVPAPAPEAAVPASPAPGPQSALDSDAIQAVNEVAEELGVSPVHLTALMSYETGGTFDPNIIGGKNNDYMGLIQFGPNERQTYGYTEGMTQADQIRGPVKGYLQDRGLKPGMGLAEMYSIVNAGSLDASGQPRWNASDGNGTVRTHVDTIASRHVPVAEQLLGYAGSAGAEGSAASEGQAAIAAMDGSTTLFSMAQDAVRDGLRYAMEATGASQRTAVPTGDRSRGQLAYLKGEGGATPEEIEEVEDAIKSLPGAEGLSQAEMNVLTLAVTREMFMAEGEPEKAQAAAASILQYYRDASSQYVAIAKAAAEDKDLDGAMKALVRAYTYVPNGKDISIKEKDGEVEILFTDLETGEETRRELLPPNELYAHIMNLNPADFDRQLMAAAGEKYEAEKRLSPAFVERNPEYAGFASTEEVTQDRLLRPSEDPLSVSDRGAIDEAISGAFDQTLEAMTPEGGEPPAIPASEALELQSIAQDVFKINEVAATDAVRAALSLTSVDPANPQVRNFAVQEAEDGSGYVVKFKNGMTINMPPETFARVATMRELRVQQAQAELEERNKPSFWENWFGGGSQGAVPATPPTATAPAIPAPRRRPPPVTGIPAPFMWNPGAVGGRGVR